MPAGSVSERRYLRPAAVTRRTPDERGVVVVWLVILLVVLLGVTALAIDVGYWQLTQTREQRAADAAALAGAVTFPGDPAQANAAALAMANSNGYSVWLGDAGERRRLVPAGRGHDQRLRRRGRRSRSSTR